MNTLKYLASTISFWKYNDEKEILKLKKAISKMYSNEDVFLLENGRTGIYLFLKSLRLPRGTKVALQAFTCNATVNPVLWNDLEPLYIDISEENFGMDINDLKKKVSEDVKVLILQHTFGISADKNIIDYCSQKGIVVIEDCAHTLGNVELGTMGDVAMLSFGVEKVLPSRVGGAMIINNKNLLEGFVSEVKNLEQVSRRDSFFWMINPFLWRVLRILPNWGRRKFGKWLVGRNILNTGFANSEDEGKKPMPYPRTISGILAGVVGECLISLKSNISHRKEISQVYNEVLEKKYEGSLVRYPYICSSKEKADDLIEKVAEIGFPFYEKWYYPVIYPRSTNLSKMKYVDGSCPRAEKISENIINLPTNFAVSKDLAKTIANIVKSC